MLRVIMAHDSYWGIGKNGELPWPKNSGDLKWFKETTLNCAVVMGRGTWDSLPFKPLPNRKNIVVSSSKVEGADISVALDQLRRITIPMLQPIGDIWIIGGGQLVEGCLDMVDELLLNNVGNAYDCDTFLPKQKITKDFNVTNTEVTDFGIISTWSRRTV